MEIQRRQDMGVQFQAKEIKLSQITLVIVGGDCLSYKVVEILSA